LYETILFEPHAIIIYKKDIQIPTNNKKFIFFFFLK
jgi:hypothetical protein